MNINASIEYDCRLVFFHDNKYFYESICPAIQKFLRLIGNQRADKLPLSTSDLEETALIEYTNDGRHIVLKHYQLLSFILYNKRCICHNLVNTSFFH